MQVFLVSLVLAVLIGIIFNTIIKFFESKRGLFLKLRKFKLYNNSSIFVGNFDERLESYVYLDTFKKWKIWIYIMSFSILQLLEYSTNINRFVIIIIGVICLLAVGDFLHSINRTVYANDISSKLMKIMFYLMQLFVFIIYILNFSLAFLESENSLELLLILTSILIFYLFLFIKNVVDVFTSYFFQFVNFILILLFFNYIIIGFNFGLFYLANNDIFEYYQPNEEKVIYENFSQNNEQLNWEYISIVIYEGIEPFFNFPPRLSGENGFKSFIPLIEHLIGFIFNLLIIGFFVSYSVTSLFERRKNGRNNNNG